MAAERWAKQRGINKAKKLGFWSMVLGLGLSLGLWFDGRFVEMLPGLLERLKKILSLTAAV